MVGMSQDGGLKMRFGKMEDKVKVAIYGGTFNPVTSTHIRIIEMLRDRFNQVIVVPTTVTWHRKKQDEDEYNFDFIERVTMLREATDVWDNVVVDDMEIAYLRDDTRGFANTLLDLKKKYGDDYVFTTVIGGDSFETLHMWRNHEVILRESSILVIDRPGHTSDNINIRTNVEHVEYVGDGSATEVRKSLQHLIDISSVKLVKIYAKNLKG